MTLERLYASFAIGGSTGESAALMLSLRSWLTEIVDFDPASGEALPDDIDAIIKKSLDIGASGKKDRIYHILEHTSAAIRHIVENMHSKTVREHEIMPVYAVREMDSASIQWLARRPGRTLREKLSGKPYIKAVRRRTSFDNAENRLFKAFFQRIDEILLLRQDYLKDEYEVHGSIERWLHSDAAQTIGSWINLSPNNTLLQDKYYRKIWDGWNRLRELDENISGDYRRRRRDFLTITFWEILARMSFFSSFRLLQSPVSIDYNDFVFSNPYQAENGVFSVKGFFLRTKNVIYNNKNKYFGQFNITLVFSGSSEKIEITFASDILSVFGDSAGITIMEKNGHFRRNFKFEYDSIREISKEIASCLIGISATDDTISDKSFSSFKKTDSVKTETAVIDLYNAKPRYIAFGAVSKITNGRVPFVLLMQYWPKNTAVDCGRASAIRLEPDIKTVSIRNLFSNSGGLTTTEKNNAAMKLISCLKSYLNVHSLVYIIPDWANDFDIENIRRWINFYYAESSPVPQSIAAVSAWVEACKTTNRRINAGAIFLVLDISGNVVSVTPVQANKSKELEDAVPETSGIYWERHPGFFVYDDDNPHEDELVMEMFRIFGKEFISRCEDSISIYENNRWHHLPEGSRSLMDMKQKLIVFRNKIETKLYENKMFGPEQALEYIFLDNGIDISNPKGDKIIFSADDLLNGAMILSERQKKAGDIPLWKDHLPELSLKTSTGTFVLVGKDTNPITPQRGKRERIPIQNTFTLRVETRDYIYFDLIQGQGSSTFKYAAFLRSPAFPLKNETVCELYLTYTYGESMPYNLQFKPKDPAAASFASVEVQWLTKDDLPEPEIKPPPFPAGKTWEEFRQYPKKNGTGTSDLIDWCVNGLKSLEDIYTIRNDREIERMINNRKTGLFKWMSRKPDTNGNYFCCVSVDGEDVFCHGNNFLEPYDPHDPPSFYEDMEIYLDVRPGSGDKKPAGLNITYSQIAPKVIYDRYTEIAQKRLDDYMERIMNNLRKLHFHLLTIWNGHSLSESDAPQELRDAILKAVDTSLVLLKDDKIACELKDELLFFLSCLHRDMPFEASKFFTQFIEDKERFGKYKRNTAYAIGDASLEWQSNLLKNVINTIINISDWPMIQISLEILAVASWRNKDIIFKIGDETARRILMQLKNSFEYNIKNMAEGKGFRALILSRHLELLLAILRLRTPQNRLLYPRDELTNWFVDQLAGIPDLLKVNNLELRSYIEFENIRKPVNEADVHNLVCALRLYLTSDDNANTIIINSVGFDD